MATSTRDFALLFLGVCVLLAGVGLWFAIADQDYQYVYQETTDSQPRFSETLGYYDQLSASEQEMVDRALDGEAPRAETRGQTPPPVVKRGDEYLVFRRYSYFDWTDPRTGGSVLVAVLGLAGIVQAVRSDVRR